MFGSGHGYLRMRGWPTGLPRFVQSRWRSPPSITRQTYPGLDSIDSPRIHREKVAKIKEKKNKKFEFIWISNLLNRDTDRQIRRMVSVSRRRRATLRCLVQQQRSSRASVLLKRLERGNPKGVRCPRSSNDLESSLEAVQRSTKSNDPVSCNFH